MSKILRRLVLVFALAALCLPAQAQRFVKVFDNIPALLAGNPNDVNTNAFVAGLSTIADGGGGFYTWKAGSTATTNADLSILKANNYSTGRWYRFNGFIIAGGTNQFDTIYVTNLYVTNLTVTSTNTYITNFFFNNTYITNISQGDNWVAEGLTQTNSDLAGIGRTWKLIATNSVEVGQPGDTGLIQISNTNAANVLSIFVTDTGFLTFSNNTSLVFTLDPSSGHTGTGTNYLSDDGTYHAVDTLTDGTDFIEVIGGKAYFSAGLDLGSDSSPFGPVDDIQMEGTLNVFGSGVGTANYEKFTIDHQGASGVILDSVAGGSGTARDILFRIGGQGKVKITSGALVPASSADYNLGATTTANSFWNDVFSKGIYYTYGFGEGTADTESGAFYHNGSSALITESLSAGSGVARDFYWKSNGVTVDKLALNSGYTGAGTKFKSDDGTYKSAGSGPTINQTDQYIPFRINSATYADTTMRWQTNSSGQPLLTLDNDSVTNNNLITMYINPYTSAGSYTARTLHKALAVENFTTFTNQTDVWPGLVNTVGCFAGYFLADPSNGSAATTTNAIAIGAKGLISPARSRLNMGLIGAITQVLYNTSQISTNVGVTGTFKLNTGGSTNTVSVSVYGEGRSSIASYFPNLENAIGLFDAGDTSFPALKARTGNGSTNLFQVKYNATSTGTSLWLYDVDTATFQQVTVGANDSGGAGFKVLRIPN